ncbi:hypothetical protein [Vibrio hyugaensis]|uniref:hypothetical protein n=1 Tax=Vibrio hyugaensis TaxID=1534743 RepID=UPI0005ED9FD5|nr:hypothetical protein [Vibrio hyugaensis]
MAKKFFIGFVLLIGYFLIPFLMINIGKDWLSESILIGIAVVSAVGFFPFFFFISRKVFVFKALHGNAIDEGELVGKIVKDCHFTVEQHADALVLTSPYMDADFISAFQAKKIKETYYMKLWFDESKHLVRFKDHLVSSKSVVGAGGCSFEVSGNSGYVSSQIYLLDSELNLVKFSNSQLHKELIKVVTENGWDLRLKMI